MAILSRYVKKNAFFSILAAVVGLWLLQIIFSYLGELESLSDNYTLVDALRYIFYMSPYYLQQFLPTGALLGAVVGLGLLASNSELIVIRAGGVSSFKIVWWVLQPAILFVLLALAVNQFILPKSNYLADIIQSDDKKTSLIESVKGYWTVQEQSKLNDDQQKIQVGNDILYISYADVDGNMSLIKRWHLDEKGNLQSVSTASSGHFIGSVETDNPDVPVNYQWQLDNYKELVIDTNLSNTAYNKQHQVLNLPIQPKSVYLLTRRADDLSLTQLYEHRQFMHSQGKRSLSHELSFWQKLLSPLAILSLVVVACSFVFGSLRTHSLGLRVVVALLFGLLFSYMQDLVGFVSLATGASPFLMVLLPIVVSAVLGIYLLKKKQ